MRYTVHTEQHSGALAFEVATAIEAISKAWKLMSAGASGVYIYDDDTDEVFWPDKFAALFSIRMVETTPEMQEPRRPTAPTRPMRPQRPRDRP